MSFIFYNVNKQIMSQQEELKIDIEAVKGMIAAGMDRKEIAKELRITLKECREIVFQSPELKGIRKPQKRKVKRQIVLVSKGTQQENRGSIAPAETATNVVEETEETETDTPTTGGEKPSQAQW